MGSHRGVQVVTTLRFAQALRDRKPYFERIAESCEMYVKSYIRHQPRPSMFEYRAERMSSGPSRFLECRTVLGYAPFCVGLTGFLNNVQYTGEWVNDMSPTIEIRQSERVRFEVQS